MIERGGGARFAEQLLQAVGLAGAVTNLSATLRSSITSSARQTSSHASAADDFDDLVAPLRHYLEC